MVLYLSDGEAKIRKEVGWIKHIANLTDVDLDVKVHSVNAEMLEVEKTYSHYKGNYL